MNRTRIPRRTTALVTVWLLVCLAGCGPDGPGHRPDGSIPDGSHHDGEVADSGPDADLWDGAPVPDAGPLPCTAVQYFRIATRLSVVNLTTSGTPATAFDIDNNPNTCAPSFNCSGGADNQFGALNITCTSTTLTPGGLNDSVFDPMVNQLGANWIIEARGLTMDASNLNSLGPFELRLYQGTWIQSAECQDATAVQDPYPHLQCDYLVDSISFEPQTCTPIAVLDNAVITNGFLTAGGDDHHMLMVYRFFNIEFGFPLHRARIKGTVTIDGDRLSIRSGGVMGGVMCPFDFASMVNDLMNVDPAECDVLNLLPPSDIEAGCGPQTPDGISVAMIFRSNPARIVGFNQVN